MQTWSLALPLKRKIKKAVTILLFNNFKQVLFHFNTYFTLWDLHSYNLIWAVCHLFPQQRWRTHTNNQSRETIGQENHVTCLKLHPRLNFVPRFLEPIPRHLFSINTSSSNTLSSFPNFYCSANTLSPVWLSYSPTEVKSQKMDKPSRHSFLQNTLTKRLLAASETPTVSNHKKK